MGVYAIIFFLLVIFMSLIILFMKVELSSLGFFVDLLVKLLFKLGSVYALSGAIWQLGKILGIFL